MTPHVLADCAEIYRAVEIQAEDRVRIGNEIIHLDPAALVFFIQARLYATFYARMRPIASAQKSFALLAALRAVNEGNALPRESLSNLPHSYTALGLCPPHGTEWLRLYWNVGPDGAVALMAAATNRLTRCGVPFRLKVMLDTTNRRRDAAVLYLPRSCWRHAAGLVAQVSDAVQCSGDIEAEVPLFTRLIRPGVGLAEDPQTGLSFGMHRTWLVARGLAMSYLLGHTEKAERLGDLAREFAAVGLSLDQPHLNRPRPDPYQL
jgi:HopA1 effector protein family